MKNEEYIEELLGLNKDSQKIQKNTGKSHFIDSFLQEEKEKNKKKSQDYWDFVDSQNDFIFSAANKMVKNNQIEQAMKFLEDESRKDHLEKEVRSFCCELRGDLHAEMKEVEESLFWYSGAVYELGRAHYEVGVYSDAQFIFESSRLSESLLRISEKRSDILSKERQKLVEDSWELESALKEVEELKQVKESIEKAYFTEGIAERLGKKSKKEREKYLIENDFLNRENARLMLKAEATSNVDSQNKALKEQNKNLNQIIKKLQRQLSKNQPITEKEEISELESERELYSLENEFLKKQNVRLKKALEKREIPDKRERLIKIPSIEEVKLPPNLQEKEDYIKEYTEREFKTSYKRKDYSRVLLNPNIQINNKSAFKTKLSETEAFQKLKGLFREDRPQLENEVIVGVEEIKKSTKIINDIAYNEGEKSSRRKKNYTKKILEYCQNRPTEQNSQERFIFESAQILGGKYEEGRVKYITWGKENNRIDKLLEKYESVKDFEFNEGQRTRLIEILDIVKENTYLKKKVSQGSKLYDAGLSLMYSNMMNTMEEWVNS